MSTDFEVNSGVAFISHEAVAEQQNSVQVPCSRLGTLLPLQKVKLAKLDVETHEYDVLKGAGKWITEHWITYLIFEDMRKPNTAAKALLREHGYKIFGLHMDLTSPGLEEVEAHDPAEVFGDDCPADYIATVDEAELLERFSTSGYAW